jgi:hypothetical protein
MALRSSKYVRYKHSSLFCVIISAEKKVYVTENILNSGIIHKIKQSLQNYKTKFTILQNKIYKITKQNLQTYKKPSKNIISFSFCFITTKNNFCLRPIPQMLISNEKHSSLSTIFLTRFNLWTQTRDY